MAPLSSIVNPLLLALALGCISLSTCHMLKGWVACTDCATGHDLSGVEVAVDCSNEKRMTVLTNRRGYFDIDIPNKSWLQPYMASPNPKYCSVTLLGGPEQLCAFKKNMKSEIVKAPAASLSYTLSSPKNMKSEIVKAPAASLSYTLSSPLTFFTSSCPPSNVEHPLPSDIGSSKTFGPFFPALPPSFFRFIPIIGIP